MVNNYNRIAPVYDSLAALVFGKAFTDAQKYLINFIPDGAHILIVGGGTGWILEEIAALHIENLTIVYVEKSLEMLTLTKKRVYKQNHVQFIHSDICDFDADETFDVLITAFLFDNFEQAFAEQVFSKLDYLLKPDGLWLFSDFRLSRASSLVHKILLKAMYLFFRLVCNVRATRLPEITQYFQSDYQRISEMSFYRKFIYSQVYKKSVMSLK